MSYRVPNYGTAQNGGENAFNFSMAGDSLEQSGGYQNDLSAYEINQQRKPFAKGGRITTAKATAAATKKPKAKGVARFAKKTTSDSPQNIASPALTVNDDTDAFNFESADQNEPVIDQTKESAFSFINEEANDESIQMPAYSNQKDSTIPMKTEPFIKKLVSESQSLVSNYEKMEQLEQSIIDIEKQEMEATSNENFALADKLSKQLAQNRFALQQTRNMIANAVDTGMKLCGASPDLLKTHSAAAQKLLPQIQAKKETMEKKLVQLQVQERMDKEKLDERRAKNVQLIAELEAPILKHREELKNTQEDLDSRMAQTRAPFEQKISEIQAEREKHNQRIQELLAEVERERGEVQKLDEAEAVQEQEMEESLEQYQGEIKKAQLEERRIQNEEQTYTVKVHEIEAPFNTMEANYVKLEQTINKLAADIETGRVQIDEASKDIEQCEAASTIIGKLNQEYKLYTENKQSVKDKFDQANSTLENSIARRKAISNEMNELNQRSDEATSIINDARLKIPKAESDKKNAIETKNFMGAQQFTKKIKQLEESVANSTKIVEDCESRIHDLETESLELTSTIAQSKKDVEEGKEQISKLDYNFFEAALPILNNLFDVSPYGARLLEGLRDMLQFSLEHTQPPRQMTKEELTEMNDQLNAKLQDAISKDDFDLAATLQEQIDSLNSKLAAMSE